MKQKGPDKQQQQRQRGGQPQVRPGADVGRAVDRSMVGRRYETGTAMRSARGGADVGAQTSTMTELERVAGELHAQHGEQIAAGSAKAGVPAESTAAVVLTETSQLRGVSDDRVALRFEPYEFFKRTGQWLVATHRDQDAEYQVFREARGIDANAAHESLRMGVGGVSGQEAEAAGFDNAQSMFTAMQDGAGSQIDGLLSVIAADEALQTAMAGADWHSVAQLRAGPGFGALGYDDALAAYADAYRQAAVGYGGGDDDDDDKKRKPAAKPRKRGGKGTKGA